MDVLREVDAYCASCDEIQGHAVMADDPSSCFCNVCGTGQPLVHPVSTWQQIGHSRAGSAI